MQIRFHGAVNGHVTGSCTEFFYQRTKTRFLVDCGMVQGEAHADSKNACSFDFDAQKIKFVLLTHAHLDHCGLLPKLYHDGFAGKVLCTRATADATRLILQDSAKFPECPYDKSDVKLVRFDVIDERKDFSLSRMIPIDDYLFASFIRSAHLPGAVSITLQWKSSVDNLKHLVMSGDLGPNTGENPYQSLLAGRQNPFGYPDYLVLESTYGDRERETEYTSRDNRLKALDSIVRKSLIDRSGPLIIPCFAMHRTQELLFDLYCLYRSRTNLPFSAPMMSAEKFESFVNKSSLSAEKFATLKEIVASEYDSQGERILSTFELNDLGKYELRDQSPENMDRLRILLTVKQTPQPLVIHLESPLALELTSVWQNSLKDRQKINPQKMLYRNKMLKEWLGVETEEEVDRIMDDVLGFADKSKKRNSDSARLGGIILRFGSTFNGLGKTQEPTIVISSGGMCEGGPVINLLPQALKMKEVTIAITGYMANGTMGAQILDLLKKPKDERQGQLSFPVVENRDTFSGKKNKRNEPKIIQQEIVVDASELNAEWVDLRGYYSGHADVDGLCDFALTVWTGEKEQKPKPLRVFLNHGGHKAIEELKQALENKSGKAGFRELSSVEAADGTGKWFDLDCGEYLEPEQSLKEKIDQLFQGQEELKTMLKALTQDIQGMREILLLRNNDIGCNSFHE